MLLAHLGIGVGGGADPGIMAGDPAAGGAVTRFARHPILDRACPAARRRIAVAAEAHSGAARIAAAEILGDEATAAVRQHRPGAAVGAAGGRGLLPPPEFVLLDDGAVAFLPAVAGRPGSGGDPEKTT